MRSNRRIGPMISLLTLTFALVASVPVIPAAQAGPISDMIARHRQKQPAKLPKMDKPPFANKSFTDVNTNKASFSTRLKKRFSIKKDASAGAKPFQDSNVTKTSK